MAGQGCTIIKIIRQIFLLPPLRCHLLLLHKEPQDQLQTIVKRTVRLACICPLTEHFLIHSKLQLREGGQSPVPPEFIMPDEPYDKNCKVLKWANLVAPRPRTQVRMGRRAEIPMLREPTLVAIGKLGKLKPSLLEGLPTNHVWDIGPLSSLMAGSEQIFVLPGDCTMICPAGIVVKGVVIV